MTPYEEDLLVKYLTHLNVLGDEGDYDDFESWYQVVRYAQCPGQWRKLPNCATRTSSTLRGSSTG